MVKIALSLLLGNVDDDGDDDGDDDDDDNDNDDNYDDDDDDDDDNDNDNDDGDDDDDDDDDDNDDDDDDDDNNDDDDDDDTVEPLLTDTSLLATMSLVPEKFPYICMKVTSKIQSLFNLDITNTNKILALEIYLI